jgi:hypothetical protein
MTLPPLEQLREWRSLAVRFGRGASGQARIAMRYTQDNAPRTRSMRAKESWGRALPRQATC